MDEGSISEATKILAPGVDIRLVNQETGQEKVFNLRYNARAVVLLEEDFGSLMGALEELRRMRGQESGGKALSMVSRLMSAGLYKYYLSPADVLDWLEYRNLVLYYNLVTEAIAQMLPDVMVEESGESGSENGSEGNPQGNASMPPQNPQTTDSLGGNSTSDAQSSTDVAMQSSGI